MAEGNDLSLLSGTGPKCRGDQSQKSDEKWSHCGNDDDLTNGARTCIFKPDGVFGIHKAGLPCRGLHQGSPEPVFPTRREISYFKCSSVCNESSISRSRRASDAIPAKLCSTSSLQNNRQM